MHIKVTKIQDNEVVYSQVVNDDSIMNKVVGHLMSQPTGAQFVTSVSHNGNELNFRSNDLDMGVLVRVVNNIVVRTKGGA